MKSIILCAGFGNRFDPHTRKCPKPALPFFYYPMMGFSFYHLKSVEGLTDVVVNVHHLSEQMIKSAERVVKAPFKLHISREEPEILETGGGVQKARDFLEGSEFFVANGDTVLIPPSPKFLNEMLSFHRKKGALATLLLKKQENVLEKFVPAWLEGEKVLGFSQTPLGSAQPFLYTGFMILSDEIFRILPPQGSSHIFTHGLLPAIEKGRGVYGYLLEGAYWFETGNFKDYMKAHRSCLELLKEGKASVLNDILRDHLDERGFENLKSSSIEATLKNIEDHLGPFLSS